MTQPELKRVRRLMENGAPVLLKIEFEDPDRDPLVIEVEDTAHTLGTLLEQDRAAFDRAVAQDHVEGSALKFHTFLHRYEEVGVETRISDLCPGTETINGAPSIVYSLIFLPNKGIVEMSCQGRVPSGRRGGIGHGTDQNDPRTLPKSLDCVLRVEVPERYEKGYWFEVPDPRMSVQAILDKNRTSLFFALTKAESEIIGESDRLVIPSSIVVTRSNSNGPYLHTPFIDLEPEEAEQSSKTVYMSTIAIELYPIRDNGYRDERTMTGLYAPGPMEQARRDAQQKETNWNRRLQLPKLVSARLDRAARELEHAQQAGLGAEIRRLRVMMFTLGKELEGLEADAKRAEAEGAPAEQGAKQMTAALERYKPAYICLLDEINAAKAAGDNDAVQERQRALQDLKSRIEREHDDPFTMTVNLNSHPSVIMSRWEREHMMNNDPQYTRMMDLLRTSQTPTTGGGSMPNSLAVYRDALKNEREHQVQMMAQTAAVMQRVCSSCGKPVRSGWSLCAFCGQKLR